MADRSLSPQADPALVTNSFRDGTFLENLQEQKDEVLALQSIFNTEDDEKLKILSEVSEDNEGLFTLLIKVCPISAHDLIRVDLAVPTRPDENMAAAASADPLYPPFLGSNIQFNRSESGWHWQGSFSVKYLSPLYLQLTLPPSYPSTDPPECHLSCDWLTMDQLTSLSQAIDTLWNESCQMPVIYNWVHWLENTVLSHLGITDHLVLKPFMSQIEKDDKDEVNLNEDIDQVIASLVQYNQEQRNIEFCKTLQECPLCFSEKPGEHFFRMIDCQHYYCHDCMAEFCEMHVKEGTVEALRCPDRECNTIIPPYIVQAVMVPEAYLRWEQLLLQKTLDAMSDTVYCPRCTSLVIAEAEEELHLACCSICYFSFCTQCQRSWHQGRNCITDQEVLETIQNRGTTVMNKREERKYQELLRKIEEEIESRTTMKGNVRTCPSCKARVEKIGGEHFGFKHV
uniref:RBR-type E3 ubiquitin transferase n=1 Tax=Arion vulgaris TaxID=1028688 RepID=A0A0B6ZMY6_9EUPU